MPTGLIVGWSAGTSVRTYVTMVALEWTLCRSLAPGRLGTTATPVPRLGSIGGCNTKRLEEAGIAPSVGSVSDR
jgi:hypothetical protein